MNKQLDEVTIRLAAIKRYRTKSQFKGVACDVIGRKIVREETKNVI